MAINPHHTVEEIQGTRCSVVEKKLTPERAAFLRSILVFNGYKVFQSEEPDTGFVMGVSDLSFNPKNIIYSRKLKTAEGLVVTPSIWYQKEQSGEFYWEY